MEPEKKIRSIEIDPKAFRYFPPLKEQKTVMNKDGTRFFYYGQVQHDDYEKEKIAEFQKYLETHKLELDREFWNNQRILKFLTAFGFKNKEVYQKMKVHEQFRADYLGLNNEKVLLDPIADLMKSGFFYPCGRDKYFRPILVFDAKKVDFKDMDRSFKATVFVQEEMLKKLMLPGQVESWDIIYNLAGMGITQMPIGVLKQLIQKATVNYGGRLNKLWVVNAPLTVTFSWKIVSAFLDQNTIDKIKISKKNTEKDIFVWCDPSQVQKKYGGTQEDRTQYWPFSIPDGVYDESRLISVEEYENKIKNGELNRNIVDPRYR